MRTLFLEPFAGISGDMTVGALVDLGVGIDALREALRRLPLPGFEVTSRRVQRGAFEGTRFVVSAEEAHVHRHLSDVRRILEAGEMPPRALSRALAAFGRLAEAEGRAHGLDPEEVHFHEVGAVDSIVDIAGAALALEMLGVEDVVVSRIRVGTGHTECAHGWIPLPAPGTAALLEGFPVLYAADEGETATPTGAAILAAWARPAPDAFAFRPERTGYGAGSREGRVLPNLLRATVGEAEDGTGGDEVLELSANLDDMTPQAVAFAAERLLAAGALDVWTTPVLMKKGRPGAVLSALASPPAAAAVERAFFAETTTLGVRRSARRRTVLPRRVETVDTPWGPVRVKVGLFRGEETVRSPEYEDCARLARDHGVPFRAVWSAAVGKP